MSDEIIPPEGIIPGRHSEGLEEALTKTLCNFNAEHDISNAEVLGVLSMMMFRINRHLYSDPSSGGGCDDKDCTK